MATATAWRMRGDILEACNCNTTCPSNFGSDPTQLPCEAIFGFRIQDGQYGNIRLDGLNFVLYFRIPGNAFQGGWTLGVDPGPVGHRGSRSKSWEASFPARLEAGLPSWAG